jgi:hypothetical protein
VSGFRNELAYSASNTTSILNKYLFSKNILRMIFAFDCHVCGKRLHVNLVKQSSREVFKWLVDRAWHGARVLERAAKFSNAISVCREVRAITFAKGFRTVGGEPIRAMLSVRNAAPLATGAVSTAPFCPESKPLWMIGRSDARPDEVPHSRRACGQACCVVPVVDVSESS